MYTQFKHPGIGIGASLLQEQKIVATNAQCYEIDVLITGQFRNGKIYLRAGVVAVQTDGGFKPLAPVVQRSKEQETTAGLSGTGGVKLSF